MTAPVSDVITPIDLGILGIVFLYLTSNKPSLRAKIDIVEYSKIPYELKFLIYFSNYKKSDYAKLCRFLST